MPMGQGWWLNPDTGESWVISSTHDAWLMDPANVEVSGLPEKYRREIQALGRDANIDEIRALAVRGGLVRIRDYLSRVSVQFWAQPAYVRETLWSVLLFLQNNLKDKYTEITLNNMYGNDTVSGDLPTLLEDLKAEKPIMRSASVVGDVGDVKVDRSWLSEVGNRLGGGITTSRDLTGMRLRNLARRLR